MDDIKRVAVVGLARQGIALIRFWCARGVEVVVTDLAPAHALEQEIKALAGLPVEYVLGGHPFSVLDDCDLVCLSGGVPPETPLPQEARRRGIPLSNDSLLTLRLAPTPVIGVTGSSGKTTTTTLVGEMLRTSSFTTWVGGNIGMPLIDRIDEIDVGDKLVLELSSFQLQLFDSSPHIAAILNITPNHLDRHPSMAHYIAAKANILRWQSGEDIVVLNADDSLAQRWRHEGRVDIEADAGQPALHFVIKGQRIGFSLEQELPVGAFLRNGDVIWRNGQREALVCREDEIRLIGRHNVANVLAACAIAGAAGGAVEAMREVAITFEGVPHRLELVRERDGVRWYNDSIATTPERLVAALRAFDAPLILIAGGRDKHLPWSEMADLTLKKVRHLVLFGEAADLIAANVAEARSGMPGSKLGIHRCSGLAEAVNVADGLAQRGDVVLLSPGGTSFDAYRDFEQRGAHFRELVRGL